jgi:hypothetical protein
MCKKTISYVCFLLILSCGTGGYIYIGSYIFKEPPEWWTTKEEVTAKVISVLHQPETGFRFEFFLDGRRYESGHAFYENVDGVVVGSKYKVAYNPSNPSQNQIILHKPVFEENEKVAYTVGQVGPKRGPGVTAIKTQSFGNDSIIFRFYSSYNVNGKKYKPVRNYVVNDKGYNTEDINRNKFWVKYWVDNPWRSIILLDKPYKEGQSEPEDR